MVVAQRINAGQPLLYGEVEANLGPARWSNSTFMIKRDKEWMPSCAAGGKTGSTSTELANNCFIF